MLGKIISISQNIDNIKQSIQNYSDKIDYNTTALSNEIKNANKKTAEMFDGKFKAECHDFIAGPSRHFCHVVKIGQHIFWQTERYHG